MGVLASDDSDRGALLEGVLQGKYQILHEIGQGGMAVVYKGIDTALEREVAVKVLHPHLAGRADSRIRLQREAKAVAKLHHPNILEIYDYSGSDCEQSYIVTEYIRGETLKDFTDRHTPSLPEVGAMIVHEVSGAVAHAHDAGIIHRDVKPENIMIRDDGVLKLMDFGIAQIVDMQNMTVTGALVGSPAHMSPEHVEGRPLDYRTDIFSLGTLLYFLCTGRLPFDSLSPHALLRQILEARYDDPRMHNPAVGKRLYQIIRKCLEREPDDRYDTVDALREDLGHYLTPLAIADPAADLVPYFDDPKGAEAELTQRVVDQLMVLAETRSKAGKVAAALEYYNQVLALQGDREDALARVQRLTSSRSRRTRAKHIGAFLATACVLAAVGWWMFGGASPEAPLAPLERHAAVVPPAALAKASKVEAPVAVAPIAAPGSVAVVESPAVVESKIEEPFKREVRGRDVTASPLPRRKLILEAVAPPPERIARRVSSSPRKIERPKAVRPAGAKARPAVTGVPITIRGPVPAALITFQGQTYTGTTPTITVNPGKHKVTVDHPNCDFCVPATHWLRIRPGSTKNDYPLSFGYKAATLVVDGPKGAKVSVAGRTVQTGQPIRFKMKKREAKYLVTLLAPGYVRSSRNVTVKSGQQVEISMSYGAKTQ
ncbi:MAG: serine/threonine protein kinase [Myxococcota bacterium]|jgi:serine/threonine protein kinase